jgi:hypothetical protein
MRSRASDPLPIQSVPHVMPTAGKLSVLAAGIAAGAVAMFFFDSVSGGRRRALVRDKIVGAGHDAAYAGQAKGKRAFDHLRGLFSTRHLDRVTRSQPENDQQLHDRIRARLGRVISHPKSVHVEVNQGRVTLTGHILTKEVAELLNEVERNAGVKAVHNQLVCHETAQGIPELQGRTEPSGREQRRWVKHMETAGP